MTVDYKSYLVQLAEADQRSSALAAGEKSIVERLLDHLEAHERSEEDLLVDYRQAAEGSADRGVRFLMELILEDEERHHRLMSAMARDVRSSLLWASQQALPSISSGSEDHAELVAQTERFLEIERDSARQLKELRKEVHKVHSGLLELILEGMQSDTEKHIDVLQYIRKQLEGR